MRQKRSGHALPILLILLCAILLGFGFDLACRGVERISHPRKYQSIVSDYSARYGVPEAMIYAMIKVESGFDSTVHSEDGKIGLMQLSPQLYTRLATQVHDTEMNAAALYDPDTNIRYGTLYLAALYQKYGMWSTVYAAWYAGEDAVDAWLQNPAYIDPDFGTLQTVPDKQIAKAVKKAVRTQELYENLYYAK